MITAFAGTQFLSAQKIDFSKSPKLSTEQQKLSYAVGSDIGKNLQNTGVEIDGEMLVRGLMDALNKEEIALSNEEVASLMQQFQKTVMEAQQKKKEADIGIHKKEGIAFLEKNKKAKGVQTTASGLQYKVIKEGKGESPLATSTVKVHYEGRLLNGTIFDSSYQRGEPTEFPLNRVIPGWTEGVQLMKPGAKYTFFIPSDLAYGDRGAGASIPPGATLIFDVELLSVQGQ